MSDLYFLIFGIVVTLLGIIILSTYIYSIITCRTKIYATITSLKKESMKLRGSTVYSYRPEFKYSYNDTEYSGISIKSTYKKDKYQANEPLLIYINPNKPEDYRFSVFTGALLTGIIAFGVGMLFVILYFV